MIVSSMFYTREEHTARVEYWCKDWPTVFHSRSDSLAVPMNGTGSKVKPLPLRISYSQTLQLKLFLVFSALDLYTYTPLRLSRGNGTIKFNTSPMHLRFSRFMIITGVLTLIMALSFLWAYLPTRNPFFHGNIQFPVPRLPSQRLVFDRGRKGKGRSMYQSM